MPLLLELVPCSSCGVTISTCDTSANGKSRLGLTQLKILTVGCNPLYQSGYCTYCNKLWHQPPNTLCWP